MTTLVTGAGGFVGRFVCRELAARGIKVKAITRANYDLFGSTDHTSLVRDVDACIHCAWYVVPGKYLVAPENTACLSGTLSLFEALAKVGAHVTGVGTCFEYAMQTTPLREDHLTAPRTLYAACKASAAMVGAQLLPSKLAWARLFYLYGPGEDERRLVAHVASKLRAGEPAALTEGSQIRDYLHVQDVASALVTISQQRVDGPINVGSGEEITVRTIAETIGHITGRSDLLQFGARRENIQDPPYVCADTRRLTALGWKPQFALNAGLADTLNALPRGT